MITSKEINDALRVRSGSIDIDGKLVDFLYTLMQDHLTIGTVEKLVRDAEINQTSGPNQYSNGWLASYAQDLANRLT